MKHRQAKLIIKLKPDAEPDAAKLLASKFQHRTNFYAHVLDEKKVQITGDSYCVKNIKEIDLQGRFKHYHPEVQSAKYAKDSEYNPKRDQRIAAVIGLGVILMICGIYLLI